MLTPDTPPGPRAERLRHRVSQGQAGLRLDQLLAAAFPGLSRRKARLLLELGGVFLDGQRVKTAGRLVREGQAVEAWIGGALERATPALGQAARAADAEGLPPATVLFEDEHLYVVDKPAGLLTAPTPESDRNNLADLMSRRNGRREAVFVVHRLDLPTSGVLVLARTPLANRALSERFRVHDVERSYVAVVAGRFPDDVASIDRPLGGKEARTRVLGRAPLGGATRLDLALETGRTHQIRLHCAGLGHPVLGDPNAPAPADAPRPPRMALHAAVLGFPHPATGEPLRFERPWPPPDLAAWSEALGG